MDIDNTKYLVDLAEQLLPDVNLNTEDIFHMYPKRNLPLDAKVTRIAPSPTGFVHLGVVYAAIISERLAHQSGGIFYLRIEDTDKKREVQGAIPDIIKTLDYFGVHFDEGEIELNNEIGAYGPYKQSNRRDIYKAFVKELIKKGLAYPCFCSAEDLDRIRCHQKNEKLLTGYYGKWAACRNSSFKEIRQKLAKGMPFVIRLKSPGNPDKKIVHTDLTKGKISFPENIQDIVLLKSDGIPTYHFAHAVDDYLMGTTHVFRGDEWLSSVPIHLQLFELLGWKPPFYGHISPIMKMEGTSKRKFSKRKDLDFSASWYRQQGFPGLAVVEYLLGLINSNFEEWRIKNPGEPNENFNVTVEKLSGSGALFDINKFIDTCKNVVSVLTADEVYDALLEWAFIYDRDHYKLIIEHKDYTIGILSIGRNEEKPRKDYSKWSDVKPAVFYFYDELFDSRLSQDLLPANISLQDAAAVIKDYIEIYDEGDDKTLWFDKIKELCSKLGYASDTKSYKKSPSAYKGSIGDIAMVLRIALTGRTNTPDLYDIMQVMGKARVLERLSCFCI